MAAIYLIRHGQASFGSADYDQLSAKGSKQAVILGQYWQSSVVPHKFYSGDLLRHGQTLKGFTEGYQGQETPMIIHSGFNEFDHVDILTNYNHQWKNFAVMSAEVNRLKDPNKTFQNEFANALSRWVSGDFDNEYQESWTKFKRRCIRALQDIIKQELASSRKSVTNSGESK
ncbi:MAG: histidine phosphatase family protein, partial [Sinobacterium sp.]